MYDLMTNYVKNTNGIIQPELILSRHEKSIWYVKRY